MKLSFVLLLAVVAFVTQAGLLTKEEKSMEFGIFELFVNSVKCYTEASDKVKTEPDADLKEKITSTLTAVKGVADNVKSLTDAQKQRIVSHYFTGTCEPLKNFFQ